MGLILPYVVPSFLGGVGAACPPHKPAYFSTWQVIPCLLRQLGADKWPLTLWLHGCSTSGFIRAVIGDLESSKQCIAVHWLRLRAQPTTPCAATAAAPHYECHGGEKTPLSYASQPSLMPAGRSVETDQAKSITSSRFFGSPVFSSTYIFCFSPTYSIPQTPEHAKCNSSSLPWQLQTSQVAAAVLAAESPPTGLGPLAPPRAFPLECTALNSISWS